MCTGACRLTGQYFGSGVLGGRDIYIHAQTLLTGRVRGGWGGGWYSLEVVVIHSSFAIQTLFPSVLRILGPPKRRGAPKKHNKGNHFIKERRFFEVFQFPGKHIFVGSLVGKLIHLIAPEMVPWL